MNLTDRDKYERFMEAMRRKLKDPRFFGGNCREVYRDGIRAAMSKMHEIYGASAVSVGEGDAH